MIKNALKYISRKKLKTIVIFLIFIIILTAMSISIYLNFYLKKIDKIISDSTNSAHIISKKNEEEFFLKELNLKKDENMNYIYKSIVSFKNGKVFEGEGVVNIENLNPEYSNVLELIGVNSGKDINEFRSNVFEITEGRNICRDDKFKIVVHERLKEKNNFKLGDNLEFEDIENFKLDVKRNKKNLKKRLKAKNKYKYEIVGFYKGIGEEKYTGLSSDLTENKAFVDYYSLNKLKNNKSEKVNYIYYFGNSKLDNEKFKIEKNSKNFEDINEKVISIKKVLNIMNLVIFTGSLFSLSLILSLWIRERMYEIGILISIGISKFEIFMQFIFELLITSIISLIFSYFVFIFLNKNIINKIVGFININANISNITTCMYSYLYLILIIFISVIISVFTIFIKKPKNILKQLS